MKVVEILKLGREILKLLQDSCVKIEDHKYIELYEQYTDMVSKGCKKSYAVVFLAEKFGISERKVYYTLKRLSADCKIRAEA